MARKREDQSTGNQASGQQQAGGADPGGAGGANHSGGVANVGGSSGSAGDGGAGNKMAAANSPGMVFASLKQQLATLGLAMREIPGDGNCLFGALADQMDGSRATHFKHRQQIVAYMRQNRLHFEPFVEDDVSFHDHMRRLSEVGTFGGNECIVAFARLHNVMVVIHQLNTALWKISGTEESEGGGTTGMSLAEVHISYHNGDHYNSVRREGDCSLAPANIRIACLPNNMGWHPGNGGAGGGKQGPSGAECHRRILQLQERLMKYTGCDDPRLARHYLELYSYRFNDALEGLIAYRRQSEEQDDSGDVDDRELSPQPSQLWTDGGSGLRVLGQQAAALALAEECTADGDAGRLSQQRPSNAAGSAAPASSSSSAAADKLHAKLSQPHISNAKRKDLKKQLRKHQNNERKRQQGTNGDDYDSLDSVGSADGAANVIVATDFACLSI